MPPTSVQFELNLCLYLLAQVSPTPWLGAGGWLKSQVKFGDLTRNFVFRKSLVFVKNQKLGTWLGVLFLYFARFFKYMSKMCAFLHTVPSLHINETDTDLMFVYILIFVCLLCRDPVNSRHFGS